MIVKNKGGWKGNLRVREREREGRVIDFLFLKKLFIGFHETAVIIATLLQ